ncbi:MAG: S-methyl-5-thioribose-1-phosphate isomerase [Candidatus Stahlbacteria bacterium]|nr:S-methyl-5-thioribose-1-phosphate isomerase [Candidatus Stahlbacteria bacterium]
MSFSTIAWEGGITSKGKVKILDQTMLPNSVCYKYIHTPLEMSEAIQALKIRGAPLIGVATAYGIALASQKAKSKKEIESAMELLANTRKTAYNVFSTLNRMKKIVGTDYNLSLLILEEAHKIKQEDELLCQKIGDAPIYLAKEKIKMVYAAETRPLLQGARLTAWELTQAGIPVTLICDSVKGVILRDKKVDFCIVGADRIAKNGDTANKIGTYTLAVLAKRHNIPFYVAAPYTTFDPTIESGDQIPIELRSADEVREIRNFEIAPKNIEVFNPAFDITPNEYITAFITEKGIIYPPFYD